MIFDEQWPAARLIPISSASGVEAQERRLASALLAVMQAVPEFGRVLLKPLGAPAGRIESFIEVPLKLGERAVRPDGILTVAKGAKTWGALVEAKTAANPLDAAQMNTYLDLARELEFEAVFSISNQYISSSTEYPVEIDRRKLKKVSLHHWSWTDVLTEAIVQAEHRGVSDPDQAYILNELIRYLSDPRSGAVSFEGMGGSWTAVRDGAREGTLRKGDPAVATVAARWDDLVRYVALSLTSALGRPVKQTLSAEERSPAARKQAVIDQLASSGRLTADLMIPDVAGAMSIVADLRSRQITSSTDLEAPREGTSKGRVSWLLRQLQKAPDALVLEARVTRRSPTIAAPLRSVREDPSALYPEKGKDIRSFRLSLTGNMGQKRSSGQGAFSDSVIDMAERYYEEVLQNLRVWKAAPPKLKRPAEKGPEAAEVIAGLIGVEPEAVSEGALPEEGVGADMSSGQEDRWDPTDESPPGAVRPAGS